MATHTDAAASDNNTDGLTDELSGTPVAGDTVIVGKNRPYTKSGGQNLGPDVLAAVKVLPSHRSSITGMLAEAALIQIAGGGDLYELSSLGSAGVIAALEIALSGGRSQAEITDAEITQLRHSSGLATYGQDCEVVDGTISGGEAWLVEGGPASDDLEIIGTAICRLDRDADAVTVRDTARLLINSTTVVLASIAPDRNARVEVAKAGTITAYGAAAKGAAGVLDLSRLEAPITITTLYESWDLLVRLPRGISPVEVFGSRDTTWGRASIEFV